MTILLILMFAAFTAAMLLQAGRALIGERGETPATKLLRDDLRQLEELVALRAMLLSALRELGLGRHIALSALLAQPIRVGCGVGGGRLQLPLERLDHPL
jgi:hypothetical protein